MKIAGYSLPSIQHPGLNVPVHPHQSAMVDAWNSSESLMLITKTGSGKTAATVLPVALNRNKRNDNCAVFVYPTNELIRDQERSIHEWLEQRLRLKVRVITPMNISQQSDDAVIELVRIDASLLEQYCEALKLPKRNNKPDKGRALEMVLHTPKAKILLINPDILYLIYGMKHGKSQNTMLALQSFQTIVFDEFHLYQGIELAHVLYLIHAARSFGAFKRVVLLSATPNPDVRDWVDKLLAPVVITMETTSSYPVIGERKVAHDIDLSAIRRGRANEAELAYAKVIELLPELRSLREARKADKTYVPCVVILNSVAKAIELEQKLLNGGLRVDQIVPIRGRSDRRIRALTEEQLVVLGTSAIEVGIDFQCDYLIFEAGDASSFMQRFGRLGRHAPGKAYLIGNERECSVIDRLPETISRTDLEEIVSRTYPEADAKAWFVGTQMGAFAALTQAFNVRNHVYRDQDGGPDVAETKQAIYDEIKKIMDEYGNKLGISKNTQFAERMFWRFARGKGANWVGDYLKIDSFRTGLPNKTVYDRSEERRRGAQYARYDVDISVILQKATNPQPNGDEIMVDDLAGRHTIGIAQSFATDERQNLAGNLFTTSDKDCAFCHNIMITRDFRLDRISSEMSRRGIGHVFCFVPKDDVSPDWKLKCFNCLGNKYILAFDGDALVLKELWNRSQAPKISTP